MHAGVPSSKGFYLPGLALLTALVAGVFCQEAAAARKGRRSPSNPQQQQQRQQARETQKASNQQLVQALRTLGSVERTLKAANHNYGGHKKAAIRDVHAARVQLRKALRFANKGRSGKGTTGRKGTTGSNTANGREPQALSNQQLAAAIPVLRQTITVLQQARHDYGGHRAKAIHDLHKAIRQLNKALAHVNGRTKPKV